MRVGSSGLRFTPHLALVAPVLDQVRNAQYFNFMPRGELFELGHARHGAVLVHDFADDAGRLESREPREIDRRLRMPAARQHAALERAQGLQPPRPDQVARLGAVGNRHRYRARAIVGRHAGTHAFPGIDRCRKRGAELALIAGIVGDQGQSELAHALFGQRKRHEAARVRRHEIDCVRRGALGRDEQVALVLAVLIVDEYQHAALAHVRQQLLDDRFAGLGHACGLTYTGFNRRAWI